MWGSAPRRGARKNVVSPGTEVTNSVSSSKWVMGTELGSFLERVKCYWIKPLLYDVLSQYTLLLSNFFFRSFIAQASKKLCDQGDHETFKIYDFVFPVS